MSVMPPLTSSSHRASPVLARHAVRARRLTGPTIIDHGSITVSYVELLDADTRLFDAELALAPADLKERTALVEIYRALGGGWQA